MQNKHCSNICLKCLSLCSYVTNSNQMSSGSTRNSLAVSSNQLKTAVSLSLNLSKHLGVLPSPHTDLCPPVSGSAAPPLRSPSWRAGSLASCAAGGETSLVCCRSDCRGRQRETVESGAVGLTASVDRQAHSPLLPVVVELLVDESLSGDAQLLHQHTHTGELVSHCVCSISS